MIGQVDINIYLTIITFINITLYYAKNKFSAKKKYWSTKQYFFIVNLYLSYKKNKSYFLL